MTKNVPDKVLVKQIKGMGRRTNDVRATLEALGLGRIGKSRVHTVNAALVGMLRHVEHMIEVTPAE